MLIPLLALGACETYSPSPLDLEGHRATWQTRFADELSVQAFLERLDPAFTETEAFDPSDGLSLREGRLVAQVFNPSLRLVRLGLSRAEASAAFAGLWRDPYFSANLLRILQNVPTPWVATPGIGFPLPVSGWTKVERSLADSSVRTAELRILEVEWTVQRDVRRAWIEWSAARARREETERLVSSLESSTAEAGRLADAGELSRLEAALFAIEWTTRRNLVRQLAGEAESTRRRLLGLLGLPPEARAELIPTLEALPVEVDSGPDAIAARNPTLERLSAEYTESERRVQLEIRRQFPDITLGPLFESDGGQSRLGIFLGSVPIPIFNANRQAIAEARRDREIARATFETTYEQLVGQWSVVEARAKARSEQLEELESTLVPLVETQLRDTLRLMQLGELDVLFQLESLRRAHETKLSVIDAREAYSLAQVELMYLTGPAPAPESDHEEMK
ncbi:MAG: TolC family protein [Planctomycetota bacterium]